MGYRTPLAKARGLGSSKEGFHHWWLQRVTAVALAPLSLWFCFSLALLPGAGYEQVRGWIASPWNTVLLICLIVSAFYHALLGIQVVIEDYVQGPWTKVGSLLLLRLLLVFLALASVYAVFKIALSP